MNKKQHKRRHQTLHRCLDELFADFITHSGHEGGFLKVSMGEFIAWSHKQTVDPDHETGHGGKDGI